MLGLSEVIHTNEERTTDVLIGGSFLSLWL